IENIIDEYLNTTILNSLLPKLIDEIVIVDTLFPNAIAQKQAANAINEANKKLAKSAKSHYHSANISVSSVIRNEKKDHPDTHYCFASVKKAKQFAMRFSTHSSLKEPVMLLDHDFSIAIHYKLILSIYMLMNSKNNNNTLYNRQLAIFIHSQYHGNTSSASHMKDLKSLTQNNRLNEILKLENTIKPI
ncbi:17708_t:CDS:2, partial [Cetraspora pellucida]